MKTKTIKEWLETLPEPHRARAFKNYVEDYNRVVPEQLQQAVRCAFNWMASPEGWDYWTSVHDGNYDATPPAPIEEFTVEYQCGEMAWWTISTSDTEYIAHSEEDAEKLCEILNKNLAEERGEG